MAFQTNGPINTKLQNILKEMQQNIKTLFENQKNLEHNQRMVEENQIKLAHNQEIMLKELENVAEIADCNMDNILRIGVHFGFNAEVSDDWEED